MSPECNESDERVSKHSSARRSRNEGLRAAALLMESKPVKGRRTG